MHIFLLFIFQNFYIKLKFKQLSFCNRLLITFYSFTIFILDLKTFTSNTSTLTYKQSIDNNKVRINKSNIYYRNCSRLDK